MVIRRVLFISRGGFISGSQRQLLYLIENLDRNLYEPVVVCTSGGELVEKLAKLKVDVLIRQLKPWRKPSAVVSRYFDAWHLYRLTQKLDISLVHCRDLWLSGYALWLAKMLNVPSVLHVHKPVTQRDVRKFNCAAAGRIVAISSRITDNLITAGISREKVVRIDDSVDTEAFNPEKITVNVLREQFMPAGEVLVGIIGRIDEFKRQLDFLKAAKETLRQTNKAVTFFIIGEVHCESYYKKMQSFVSQNGMEKHVHFTGRRFDIPKVLGSLDILVSNSGGSVMFEAMAAGKSVISAGFTQKKYSYHIQDGITGLLIESKEPADLAGAMGKLIDNPQLRTQLGLEARKWALKELTHTAMAEKTGLLYEKLLMESRCATNVKRLRLLPRPVSAITRRLKALP